MDAHDQALLHSSVECNWRTPPECFLKLDGEFDFKIDAAADAESALTTAYFGPGNDAPWDNGLTCDWRQRFEELYQGDWPLTLTRRVATLFLNPPFSKTLLNAYNTGWIKVGGMWVDHPKDPERAKVYDVAEWARKCWEESQQGLTIVGIFPFAPQTDWYRRYVYGHNLDTNVMGEVLGTVDPGLRWAGHAATQERRLPHRISFIHPEGKDAGNAGVNSVIVVWEPAIGRVGPWSPHSFYWSYR